MGILPHRSLDVYSLPQKHHAGGHTPRPIAERFWAKVDIKGHDECWEWQAAIFHSSGYGMFSLRTSTPVIAHRVAFTLTYGDIPDDLLICHRCDNRRCCNPHHLFLGTQKDNMQDCKQKGRFSHQPNPSTKEEHPGWDQADTILSLYKTGEYKQTDLARMFHISQTTIHYILLETSGKGKRKKRRRDGENIITL